LSDDVRKIINQPYYSSQNTYPPRYYQRVAINRAVEEIAQGKDRLLLVMATGTGKTYTTAKRAVAICDKIAEEQGISPKKFSKKAIELLQKQDWTGNIRELRNVVERLFILGGKEISEDDVKAFAGK